MKRITFALLLGLAGMVGFSQTMTVNNTSPNNSPYWLAENVLVDPNFIILPYGYNGLPLVQPNTTQVGYFKVNNNTGANPFPIDSGIVMCANAIQDVLPGTSGPNPNTGPFTDPDLSGVLTAIGSSGYNINDRAQMTFSFVATSDSIVFNYVFGSHEYPTYTCSSFNDVFGFFLTGVGINGNSSTSATTVNLATIPGTSTPVAINTINQGFPGSAGTASACLTANPNYVANSVFYNASSGSTVSLGGYTQKFTATAQVVCGNYYEIRLAICNTSDHALSSAVFLEAQSFKSPSINISAALNNGNSFVDSTIVEGCAPSYVVFEKDGNVGVGMGINFAFTGTALNGIDVSQIPDSIWIPPGIKSDTLVIEAFDDGITETNESLIITMQPVATSCFLYPPKQMTYYIRDKAPVQTLANVGSSRDTIFCPGDTTQIHGFVSGGEGVLTSWWADDTAASSVRVIQPTQTTTYYHYGTDECASDTVVDSVTIYLANYEPMTYNLDTVLVCRGDTASFLLDIQNGRPPYAITWHDGSTYNWFEDVPSDTTYYPFTVYDGCGIMIEDSMMAYVAPDPLASFSYLNDVAIPLRVQFSNRSANEATWLWDFGDGNTSTDHDPVWDFPKPGTYQVTLSIITADGCVDEVMLDVTVETDFYLYVPTAFTPDGDGLNECFEINGVGFESFEIKIFDRWGGMVFTSNNLEECWDGTINGQPAPQGVYTYTIFLRLPFDKIHQRQGMVTVYR